MEHPVITDVAIKKEGRYWAVNADGKLLAIVVYRKGAEAIQELVQRLAAIPVTAKANMAVIDGPTSSQPGRKPNKQASKPTLGRKVQPALDSRNP